MNASSKKHYDVAAFVWPSYTGREPRSLQFWPEGIGEWQTVVAAAPKYPGHQWPRRPLWGCCDEADPRVMEMQIAAAAEHGVNVFIYDWYWYDRRPFLEQCLNDGFLGARNNSLMKFYLMWANHDANLLWDTRLSNHRNCGEPVWLGSQSREEFEVVARRVIGKYFSHPSYYKIDGAPVFMVYDLENLVKGLGGEARTAEALAWFRAECVRAGFSGLHLQLAAHWAGQCGAASSLFDSLSHYQIVHFTNVDREYSEIIPDMETTWGRMSATSAVPYFAHVSIGWDNNPRHKKFMPGVTKNNTPDAFAAALRRAKAFVDAHPAQAPLITLNSWNEWTEGSYLEPDDLYGYGYLEAVKSVFG